MDYATVQRCKMVVVGESGVGKSLVIQHLMQEDTHNRAVESTVGATFFQKAVLLDNWSVLFDIWDTAGQERFRSVGRMYYRGAEAAIIMYDVTNRASFNELHYWVNEIKSNAEKVEIIILVGNKVDLVDKITISTEEGKKKAEEEGVLFMEASAVTGHNVNAIFNLLAEKVRQHSTVNKYRRSSMLSLNRRSFDASSTHTPSKCSCRTG